MEKKYYVLFNDEEIYDRLYLSHHGARTRMHIDKEKGWEVLEITSGKLQHLLSEGTNRG